MQKITPFLWFDKEAREAAEFYVSVFPDSKITSNAVLKDTPSGDAETVNFTILGHNMSAISAGPYFKLNPSISFMVACQSEAEVDEFWNKLSPGGIVRMEIGSYPFSKRYGWIEDRFGVSWQLIFPEGYEMPQRVVPTLMFVKENCGKAEEAMNFYASVFKDSKVGGMARYPAGGVDKEGTVMHGLVTLETQDFYAMDSAQDHQFQFNEAVSFMVSCKDQAEIDYYWEKLSAVPESEQCGWLKDKYGVSWQIVPEDMDAMMQGDPEKAKRVTQAFLKMKKFDLAELKRAAEGVY